MDFFCSLWYSNPTQKFSADVCDGNLIGFFCSFVVEAVMDFASSFKSHLIHKMKSFLILFEWIINNQSKSLSSFML